MLGTTNYKRCSVVNVSGRIDSNTAPEFEATLQNLIENGTHNIVVETSGVKFISSAGLRSLVSCMKACKKKGGELVLATPSKRVTEVMKLAGLNTLFTTYNDVTAAVGNF
mgnify:CR=1 FL=1